MQYESCQDAMRDFDNAKNFDKNQASVTCPHKPTVCDVKGFGQYYTCTTKELQEPQIVYSKLNGTSNKTIFTG